MLATTEVAFRKGAAPVADSSFVWNCLRLLPNPYSCPLVDATMRVEYDGPASRAKDTEAEGDSDSLRFGFGRERELCACAVDADSFSGREGLVVFEAVDRLKEAGASR